MLSSRPLRSYEERPTRRGYLAWLVTGADRQGDPAFLALICAWTFAPVALWLAVIGAFVGIVAGIFGAESIGLVHTFHLSEGAGFFGAIAGAVVGFLAGLWIVYHGIWTDTWYFIGALVSGVIVSAVILALVVHVEDWVQRLRGYRELSDRERKLIDPLLDDVLARMNISGARPHLYMSGSKKPAAWSHPRSIVLAEGLLGEYGPGEGPPVPDLPVNALTAILAHEVHHWRKGDAVGLHAVWCAFWPIVGLYNLAHYLQEQRGWVGWFGFILVWPTWVCIRLLVVPDMSSRMREQEYEADQAAALLGEDVRLGLRQALTELAPWEAPRTGWEDALAATHPQIELRLQRLETPPAVPVAHEQHYWVTVNQGTELELVLRSPAIDAASRTYVEAEASKDERRIAAAAAALSGAVLQRFKQAKAAMDRNEPDDIGIDREELEERIEVWTRSVEADRRRARVSAGRPLAVPREDTQHPLEAGERSSPTPPADEPPAVEDDDQEGDAGSRWGKLGG